VAERPLNDRSKCTGAKARTRINEKRSDNPGTREIFRQRWRKVARSSIARNKMGQFRGSTKCYTHDERVMLELQASAADSINCIVITRSSVRLIQSECLICVYINRMRSPLASSAQRTFIDFHGTAHTHTHRQTHSQPDRQRYAERSPEVTADIVGAWLYACVNRQPQQQRTTDGLARSLTAWRLSATLLFHVQVSSYLTLLGLALVYLFWPHIGHVTSHELQYELLGCTLMLL